MNKTLLRHSSAKVTKKEQKNAKGKFCWIDNNFLIFCMKIIEGLHWKRIARPVFKIAVHGVAHLKTWNPGLLQKIASEFGLANATEKRKPSVMANSCQSLTQTLIGTITAVKIWTSSQLLFIILHATSLCT